MNPSVLSFEKELLIRLAPTYLACRWRVMGHRLIGKSWPRQELANDLMGMRDYAWEMNLLCRDKSPTLD